VTLAIRPARRADLPVIRQMMREFVDHLNRLDEDDADEVSDAEIARIEPLAFGPGAPCTIIVAQSGGEPAGYLTYFWGMSMDGVGPALFVGDLFVRQCRRKTGVGRALMLEARAIAERADAIQVNWTVWRRNRAARRFYKALGAEPYDEEVLMTWNLRDR
jgi:GNAT superfamily N-acetyltransferase